jgi:hypothetical protein
MNDTTMKATSAQRERAVQPTIGGSIYMKPQEMAWEMARITAPSSEWVSWNEPTRRQTNSPARQIPS